MQAFLFRYCGDNLSSRSQLHSGVVRHSLDGEAQRALEDCKIRYHSLMLTLAVPEICVPALVGHGKTTYLTVKLGHPLDPNREAA